MIQLKENNGQKSDSWRISIFILMFIALFLVVGLKLFNIQILNTARYQIAAKKQYESRISLKSNRGTIYDRKLNALVSNVNNYSFAADPNMVDNKDSVAEIFSKIFEKDKNYYLDKLNTPNTSFVWLERRVDSKYDAQCRDINLTGVIKLNEAHRQFNYGTLASQIIGNTDIDNNGLTGIELEFNSTLQGEPGYIVMQKDGLGRKRPAVDFPRKEPKDGDNIVLTLDMNIQKIVEEELERGVNANDALGGKCVVMDVKTGEVLGMYSVLNSNASETDKANNFSRLTFLTDLYEPGSTFKVVTASASLEEGIESRNDIIQTHGGEYMVDGITVKDSHKSSSMTFQQIIEQSSNVGFMQVASKLGPERFYKYSRDFGFGISTGIELPGEVKGSLKRPVDFSPVSLKFMAIGYEVLVTALQMADAYACVANDGVLMKPSILKKITNPDGSLFKENQPEKIRSVITKKTARTLTELLTGVVEKGTGMEAKIENVRVAGKTGTAQKLDDGKYSKKNYTSSFVGYFPAENPQIVIAVIVDAPAAGEIYGGKVSAPIFKQIAEKIIALNGVLDFTSPQDNENNGNVKFIDNGDKDNPKKIENLDLIGFEVSDAVKLLKDNNIDFEISGSRKNAVVSDMKESIDNSAGDKPKIILYTQSNSEKGKNKNIKPDEEVMPDFKGMSMRKCVRILSDMGVEFAINGSGRVITQKPDAGTNLQKIKQVVINCQSVN
ncbi:MAG: penicillin-binding transpeptidase domain-containing protein [Ignavibacteria bacterium]